jgi:hypothetical protein
LSKKLEGWEEMVNSVSVMSYSTVFLWLIVISKLKSLLKQNVVEQSSFVSFFLEMHMIRTSQAVFAVTGVAKSAPA